MLIKLLTLFLVFLEILGEKTLAIKTESVLKNLTFFNNSSSTLIREEVNLNLKPPLEKKYKENPPSLTADSILVLDASTSQVLFEKDSTKKLPIASLTKIMTAVVVLENYNLDEVLSVPKEAVGLLPGSVIYLKEGERVTVENLLYGLLLYSGNDCAYTLASKIEKLQFVSKMNEKAKQLGLKDTYFEEPSGLSSKNVSTARDLAFLFLYALKNENFSKITRTNEILVTSVDQTITHRLKNTNRLLRDYPGTFSGKTGYTEEAGHCLIVAVNHADRKIIAVVLGADVDQFEETKKLLNWCFKTYVF